MQISNICKLDFDFKRLGPRHTDSCSQHRGAQSLNCIISHTYIIIHSLIFVSLIFIKVCPSMTLTLNTWLSTWSSQCLTHLCHEIVNFEFQMSPRNVYYQFYKNVPVSRTIYINVDSPNLVFP